MMVGVVFFKEPFPPLLKFAFSMALIGVLIQIGFGDHLPWIALVLAFSFCGYGIIKKMIRIRPTQFSLMEGVVGLIPALAAAYWLRSESEIILQNTDWILLIGSGFVTGLPLFLFAIAARSLPYSLMGILQFISPSLQFLVGLFLFDEALTPASAASFCFIWIGVSFYLLEKWHSLRSQKSLDGAI
jgi:chloramphenicol-sensitive protein RarD